LDSESRLKLAAGLQTASASDVVCGMKVDERKARAANQCSEYRGLTYYFCNEQCKRTFDADPAALLKQPTRRSTISALASEHAGVQHTEPQRD
jgi:YHS domain-containing protein